VGTCRAFEQLEAARACVVFERLGKFGFVLYFMFVGGLSLALVNVTARLASSAIAGMIVENSSPNTSRVTTGLEAQERASRWQTAAYILERPRVPDVSATALAKGMDAAENHPLPPDANSSAMPVGPRVAGWTKRIKAKVVTSVADESPGRIILRSLRAEM
jgi:hypothetical protein